MKKISLLLTIACASAYFCSAQPYAPQTYKEYLEVQSLNRQATKKLDNLLKNSEYERILSYVDSITPLGYDVGQHRYSAIAHAKLGDTIRARQEVKKHLKRYPNTPAKHLSDATNIPQEELESYQIEYKQEQVDESNTLVDSRLCHQIDSISIKDQYNRRYYDPVTKSGDPLQLKYDRENCQAIRKLVEQRGRWLNRYLTPKENGKLRAMSIHHTVADMHYYLSYILPDCEQGYTDWQSLSSVVWKLQDRIGRGVSAPAEYPREMGRSYRGIYGIALDKDERIDFDRSFMGIHMISGCMRRKNTTYLVPTTNFTSEYYVEELERLRQYYISLGIPPEKIKVVEDKIEHKAESINDPVTYVVVRVEGDNTQWTNPIYFDYPVPENRGSGIKSPDMNTFAASDNKHITF